MQLLVVGGPGYIDSHMYGKAVDPGRPFGGGPG